MLKKLSGALAAVMLLAAFTATQAGAAEEAVPVEVDVAVKAKRFKMQGGEAIARGPVKATVLRSDGSTETIKQRADIELLAANKCQILRLSIDELYLDLLGLIVTSSPINVKIYGQSKRPLGKLFCNLSRGLTLDKKKLLRRSVRSMNRRLDGDALDLVRLNANVYPQPLASPGTTPSIPEGTCEVLDLDLGPLELDLLGLRVDLYGSKEGGKRRPVRLNAYADPDGGLLGSLLCDLANSQVDLET